jgi:branched-chain amino acid transport system substrate-binding protein
MTSTHTHTKADEGLAIKTAIEMAIAQAAPARLPGVNVTLKCVDTRCNELRALRGARRLARANTDAVIGDVCSPATLAATAVAQKYQMPLISPGSTSPALTAPVGGAQYFFRTIPSDRYMGGFAADAMLADGVDRVVVVLGSDECVFFSVFLLF